MAKDPAFLFYTGDFTTGTQFFTDEQVGKYVRLLMAQHQLGHLEEKHMLFICKSHDKDIFSKFIKDENGYYYNERLDSEIVKRKKYSESRSNNRKKTIISESYDNHMENENKDINTIHNKTNKEFKKEFNTKPIPENFNGLPDNTQKAAFEIIFRTQQVRVTDDNLIGMWEIFKIQNLTGDNWYANEGKVYSHFINWIKSQKFENTLSQKEVKIKLK